MKLKNLNMISSKAQAQIYMEVTIQSKDSQGMILADHPELHEQLVVSSSDEGSRAGSGTQDGQINGLKRS